MANERLRAGLAAAGITSAGLAEQIGVDPKSVERWIQLDRVPHRVNRQKVAALLGRDEAYLWSSVATEERTTSTSRAELVAFYPNRGAVPAGTWETLIDEARESIDVLAFAASFLHDTISDFGPVLAARARAGVRVRLLFGDPTASSVQVRGGEEGIGDLLTSRCRLTWRYVQPVLGEPGLEARAHSTTLYASIFRFDDDLLANHHLYGAPANHSPVLHLRRLVGGRAFATYVESFDRVWANARPVDQAWVA